MPRKKKINKSEKPVKVAASTGLGLNNHIDSDLLTLFNKDNSTIKNCSLSMEEITLSETQLYDATGMYRPVYIDNQPKGRNWSFIVYLDSAPEDWREQLEKTGLPFAISPLHDKDVNPDGTPKKPHYHVIISYPNTTTYNSICGLREITKGPFPIICRSVSGMYAYFTHKHNPEKYQYDSSDIQKFNGWEKTLEAHEVNFLMEELTLYIFDEDITEYAELMVEAKYKGSDYMNVAMNHTLYFNSLIRSYRHSRKKTLIRYCNGLEDGELKKAILKRIDFLHYMNSTRQNC